VYINIRAVSLLICNTFLVLLARLLDTTQSWNVAAWHSSKHILAIKHLMKETSTAGAHHITPHKTKQVPDNATRHIRQSATVMLNILENISSKV